jgi:hypothetical protein
MLTGIQEEEDVTPQKLVAVTQMLPPPVPEVTVSRLEPCPPVMIHPEGTVHVYDEAPVTGCMK